VNLVLVDEAAEQVEPPQRQIPRGCRDQFEQAALIASEGSVLNTHAGYTKIGTDTSKEMR
jgi:hypothetical protein